MKTRRECGAAYIRSMSRWNLKIFFEISVRIPWEISSVIWSAGFALDILKTDHQYAQTGLENFPMWNWSEGRGHRPDHVSRTSRSSSRMTRSVSRSARSRRTIWLMSPRRVSRWSSSSKMIWQTATGRSPWQCTRAEGCSIIQDTSLPVRDEHNVLLPDYMGFLEEAMTRFR